jgi:hypothetical protein
MTRRGFGPARLDAVVCLYVLIDLPAGMPWCVAKRATNRSGIEKHRSPGRT